MGREQKPGLVPKWEYRVLDYEEVCEHEDSKVKRLRILKDDEDDEMPYKLLEAGLNGLGEQGWNLILQEREEWYIFKRRKEVG